jgi:hypothetical protein
MKGIQMNHQSTLTSMRLGLAVVVGLLVSAVYGRAQDATATISGIAVTGGFDYTILFENTGSTDFNSFWYGWTASGNNLPSNPSNAGNSLGWDNILSGTSIIWQNNTGTALTPGQTGSFTFFSTATPAAITTPPSGGSVAYVGGVDFSQDVPGDSTPPFSPTLVTTPEPSTVALLAVGSLGLLASGRRRLHRRQRD